MTEFECWSSPLLNRNRNAMWCFSLSCCIHVVFLIIIFFLREWKLRYFCGFLSIKIPLQLIIYLKAKWKVCEKFLSEGGKEANITSVVNAVKEICFLQQTLPCLMCQSFQSASTPSREFLKAILSSLVRFDQLKNKQNLNLRWFCCSSVNKLHN